ncbi:uncharacterized protein LOC121307043 isoform X2 [Polyodon spathula]|uniref:uncharacterized protein LOC121307043 isoform X2 n=1 Tax=Polyodon spathula TaxID=7913 RepID=UPI001B7F63CC|nr:uncharacterized protein LOC121307043 isoform X2 [Polyodon spathula]
MTSCQETEGEPRFQCWCVRKSPGYRTNMAAPIDLHLEFGGGAELLFGGVKDYHVKLPSQSEPCKYSILSRVECTGCRQFIGSYLATKGT